MKTTCSKCGGANDRLPQRYCRSCHRLAAKKYRVYHAPTPEQERKDLARSIARYEKKRGRLVQQPCRRCGSPDSQMHHHDYGRPTDVEWLCSPCHLAWHKFWLARIKDIFASWALASDHGVVDFADRKSDPSNMQEAS